MFHSHVEIAREYVDFCWPFLKEQHKQMCYIFCFSYPLDLRKKVLNPVTCWDRCTQKQTNLQIIWYFQDHHQIFFFNFKSQSPNFPVRHQLFSEDFDVVLMQPSHTHTHLSTHKKKICNPAGSEFLCFNWGDFFFRKSFDCWSQISHPRHFWQESKNYIPISSSLKTPKPWK